MDMVVVVLDATENPYNQVNITIIGNLVARKYLCLLLQIKWMLKSRYKKSERLHFLNMKLLV